MSELYIGLMSGTSMDALDAVLVDFSQQHPALIASHQEAFPADLRIALLELCQPGPDEIQRLGVADIQVAQLFALAANTLLAKSSLGRKDIKAIGSHGQTIRHHPHGHHPFTLQIGDPNTIAEITQITTIADFRRRDIAKGGQGAPLAPAFHNAMFRNKTQDRIVLNLGGIANITWLPANTQTDVIGFDVGPANTLLDAWTNKHRHHNFDANGQWAATGKIDINLLALLLTDPYFARPYPKSTGREYFNLEWLNRYLQSLTYSLSAQDIQATLCELTAMTIRDAVQSLTEKSVELFLCGGGIHNLHLLERLQLHCNNVVMASTEALGISPQLVEAMAFAWLAQQTLAHKPGNLPSVTGARGHAILGGIYYG